MATNSNGDDTPSLADATEGQVPSDTGSPEEGLTVREAAERTGMTEKMIRVRIRNGSIESWKVQGKFGPEWRVRLPESEYGSPDSDARNGEEPNSETPPATASDTPTLRPEPVVPPPPANTVPAALLYDLLVRHEEISIRLGRSEAQLEALLEAQEERESESAPAAPPAEEREGREVPVASMERLQRIARGEAEARYLAEAEVTRLRQRLLAAENTIVELQTILRSLGVGR
ncbi:MAG: hypothetical protein KY468_02870 [Armatimonadetes bacterium]|nr:hypothetical protein [Armatimonadota bacterium]